MDTHSISRRVEKSIRVAVYGRDERFCFVSLPLQDTVNSKNTLESAAARGYSLWCHITYDGRFHTKLEDAGLEAGADKLCEAMKTFSLVVVGMIEQGELPPLDKNAVTPGALWN